mgnify:CR=1 FL=1
MYIAGVLCPTHGAMRSKRSNGLSKVSILGWGSNQFQYIERGAGESQYFSLFLRRVGSPKLEFDDTSSVIWGVRK